MKQSLVNGAKPEVGTTMYWDLMLNASICHFYDFTVARICVSLSISTFVLSDYKQTSLAKYVKLFDQFLDAMARSRKGEMLKKSGMFPNYSFSLWLSTLDDRPDTLLFRFIICVHFSFQISRKNFNELAIVQNNCRWSTDTRLRTSEQNFVTTEQKFNQFAIKNVWIFSLLAKHLKKKPNIFHS